MGKFYTWNKAVDFLSKNLLLGFKYDKIVAYTHVHTYTFSLQTPTYYQTILVQFFYCPFHVLSEHSIHVHLCQPFNILNLKINIQHTPWLSVISGLAAVCVHLSGTYQCLAQSKFQ